VDETMVTALMTSRSVVFSLAESLTVQEYFDTHYDSRYSRIPVYAEDDDMFTGFVLKDDLLHQRAYIMVILDEYGGMKSIITMEDILVTLLGFKIMDESDKAKDMQEYARRMWKSGRRRWGLL
jgi:CBS domain containing-hemolysin-like protein